MAKTWKDQKQGERRIRGDKKTETRRNRRQGKVKINKY